MAHPFIRSRFNYDRDQHSIATGLACEDESLAQQQFKEETDINVLVKRFHLTGQLPEGVRMPTYEDFSEVYDFHSAANAIAEANEAFMQMPADLRIKRFNNDPAAFVAFCSNDDNRGEAEKLGLVAPKQPLNTAPAAPVNTTPAVGAGDGSAGGSTQ